MKEGVGLSEKGSFLDVLLKFSVLSLSCKWYFFQFLEADLSFMLPEIFERKGEIGEGAGEEGRGRDTKHTPLKRLLLPVNSKNERCIFVLCFVVFRACSLGNW